MIAALLMMMIVGNLLNLHWSPYLMLRDHAHWSLQSRIIEQDAASVDKLYAEDRCLWDESGK